MNSPFGIRKRWRRFRAQSPAGALYLRAVGTILLVGIPVLFVDFVMHVFDYGAPAYAFMSSLLILLVFVLWKVFFHGFGLFAALKEYVTFLPVKTPERDDRYRSIPWGTYGLIYVNALIFAANPWTLESRFITDNLVFLPEAPNSWNVPVSIVTSMFLHANIRHLLGNLFFLWAFGSAVERRLGTRPFLMTYLLSGLFANVFSAAMVWRHLGWDMHGLGASGAISGVLGLFAVRCFHKRMIVPIPLLGIEIFLPVGFRMVLPAPLVMAWFFMKQATGSLVQLVGYRGMVNYLAHLGGIIAGLYAARYFGAARDAIEETRLDAGLSSLKDGVIRDESVKKGIGLRESEAELRKILAVTPDHHEALVQLARIVSHYSPTDEGKAAYRKAIPLLLRRAPAEVPEVFSEYFNKYCDIIAPDDQFQVSLLLEREGFIDLAARTFEHLSKSAEAPPLLRRMAALREAEILDRMGLPDAAAWSRARARKIADAPVDTEAARLPEVAEPRDSGTVPPSGFREPCPGKAYGEAESVPPGATPEETRRLKVFAAGAALGGLLAGIPLYYLGWSSGSVYVPAEEPAEARICRPKEPDPAGRRLQWIDIKHRNRDESTLFRYEEYDRNQPFVPWLKLRKP